MLSDLVSIEDNDWDSVRQAHGAYARDLKRIFLSLGLGGDDMGGGVPKSANDQTIAQDGSYGYPVVTTDMLDEVETAFNDALEAAVAGIPSVTYPIPINKGGTGAITQQAAINALAGGVTNNRVLRANGTNVELAQVALTTDVSGSLPVANGGTAQTTVIGVQSAFGCHGDWGEIQYIKTTGSGSQSLDAGVWTAVLWGGGGGGAASDGSSPYYSGTGGSGGIMAIIQFVLTSTTSIAYVVGTGGSGGTSSGSGSPGGDSSVTINSIDYLAYGGEGGSAGIGYDDRTPYVASISGDTRLFPPTVSRLPYANYSPSIPYAAPTYGVNINGTLYAYGGAGAGGGSAPSNPGSAGVGGAIIFLKR